MPLLSSCLHFCQTFINFWQICHFIKLSFVKLPLFVISFVFGQTLGLSIFAEICRFRLNLPFSCNRHLPSFPSLSLHWVFAKHLMDSCPIPHFLNLPISWNRQLSILLVCTWRHSGHVGGQEQKHLSPLGTKLYFHVNYSRKIILYWSPTLPPCLVVANHKNAYFVVSFKIFARPLMNPNTPISQNLSFFVQPTIIDMPVFSSCFNFCQTYKFLPNL